MVLMAILIVVILVSLLVAGSAAANEIAQGKYELDGSDGSRFIPDTSGNKLLCSHQNKFSPFRMILTQGDSSALTPGLG